MSVMQTASIRSVLDGISALLGAEPVTAGGPEHVSFIANLNRHLPRGWKHAWWSETLETELRAYRAAWAAGETYAAGAEVFFPADGGYYAANSAPNNPAAGQSPATHPAKWAVPANFARYIALVQPGQTVIAAVKRVCRRDPRVYPQAPGELDFDLTGEGIVPDSRAGAQVWVEFQRVVPKFTAALYDAARTYAIGELCYDDATGECYQASQVTVGNGPTALTYWAKVGFPERLKTFIETACYADALRGDGQTAKALAEQGNADTQLILACDDAFAGQGQYTSASYSKR